MVFDASLLNTQHYKLCIKGKVEPSRERSSAIEKGIFKSTSTTATNCTFFFTCTHLDELLPVYYIDLSDTDIAVINKFIIIFNTIFF